MNGGGRPNVWHISHVIDVKFLLIDEVLMIDEVLILLIYRVHKSIYGNLLY